MPIYKVKSPRSCLRSTMGAHGGEAGIQAGLTAAPMGSLLPAPLLLRVLPGPAASASSGGLLNMSNLRVLLRPPVQARICLLARSLVDMNVHLFKKPYPIPCLCYPKVPSNPQVVFLPSLAATSVVTPGRKPLFLSLALGTPAAWPACPVPQVLCQAPGVLALFLVLYPPQGTRVWLSMLSAQQKQSLHLSAAACGMRMSF